MTDKQIAIEAIQRLPDKTSLQEISREIEFLAAIREGEDEADRGLVIPLEQLENTGRIAFPCAISRSRTCASRLARTSAWGI